MQYGSDQSLIKNYPVAPYSSFKNPTNKIGFVILWTIENIRKNHPYSSIKTFDSYPSQNSLIFNKSIKTFQPLLDQMTLETVHQHYQTWWDIHDGANNFDLARKIDPLKETDFKWK